MGAEPAPALGYELATRTFGIASKEGEFSRREPLGLSWGVMAYLKTAYS